MYVWCELLLTGVGVKILPEDPVGTGEPRLKMFNILQIF